ncbi:MAG: hypothetical protein WD356_05490 [Pseudomonadales bacterium]
MKTFFKWLGITFGVIALAIVLFFAGMRFHDGPIEIISGGPFKTGEPTRTPEDWRFIEDRQTIEFQTMEPPTSRTVWLAVHDGRLFLISGYMTTTYGKLWKQWPHYIEADDRVILRIDGKLYEQRLERIQQGDVLEPVMAELGRKYGFEGSPEAVESGYAWLYEVKPR